MNIDIFAPENFADLARVICDPNNRPLSEAMVKLMGNDLSPVDALARHFIYSTESKEKVM